MQEQVAGGQAIPKVRAAVLLGWACLLVPWVSGDKPGGRDDDPKKQALASIQRQVPQLVDMAGRIWEFAETALREHRSVEVLAEYAERHGFEVERGIADLPTASGERN